MVRMLTTIGVPARFTSVRLRVTLVCGLVLGPAALSADPIAVRHAEGIVHGFLIMRAAADGTVLADGDLIQTSRGDRVTARLVFRFKDGSIQDETAVYSQRGSFRLISDHLIQKGPIFPKPLEMTISRARGRVAVHYTDDGQQKVVDEPMELAPDLANGMILTLMKNVESKQAATKVSMIAATPKPRLVKLVITNAGEESFSLAGSKRQATHYVIKIEIGGVSGLLAPLVGKQPPDSHVWILGGVAPAFVRSEQPLFLGGPMIRIELTSPVWEHTAPSSRE
jgi:hypothetical protein